MKIWNPWLHVGLAEAWCLAFWFHSRIEKSIRSRCIFQQVTKQTIHLLFLLSTESTAYEFGRGTGIMTFQYPDGRWPDSRRDLLALGFMTKQDDAVVLRLESANSNDYMELEIVSLSFYLKKYLEI